MHDTLLLSAAIGLRIISNPLGNVVQKQLTVQGTHPLCVNFLAYLLLTALCFLSLSFVAVGDLNNEFWLYSVLGGIFGALGNGLLIKALHKGNLSILGPINSYKSIIGLFFGMLLLGEIPNLWGVLGIVIIIYGSSLVLDTTEERFTPALLRNKEIQFRIGAMALTAIEAVFVKKVILSSSPALAFISWCFFGALFSFILVLAFRVSLKHQVANLKRSTFIKLLLLISCIGTMQLSTNFVLDRMDVGYALSLFQLSILVSVLLGYRIFQEKDIGKKFIGSAIMIVGSAVIIFFN